MTLDELRQIVSEGEHDRLELKKTTNELKGGMESLCGFLNSHGGTVAFGVTSKIVGQDVTDATLREIAEELRRFDPPIQVDIERIDLDTNRAVLVLATKPGHLPPYVYGGRPFRRIGSTTSLMPQAEYHRRLLQRDHARQRWENQPAVNYRIEDLDPVEIQQTVTEAIAAGRLLGPWSGVADTLQKFHLLVEGMPTQAAVVAFARDPMPDYPQCALRMARFRGVNKNEFLDQQQLTGHAFALLREAQLFLRRHLPVAGRIEPGVLERIDEPLFPPVALREALVNALIHREYSIYGGATSVAIYDDRVEIISAGGLPFGLTPLDLVGDHESKPRNPLLAELFFRRGLIERWGRGTQKIIDLCVAAGHPPPRFEELAGSVVVQFMVKGYVPPHRIEHDLTDRQRRLLHALRDGAPRRFKDLMSTLATPAAEQTIRNDLILLRTLGLVESSGRGNGARWNLVLPSHDTQ